MHTICTIKNNKVLHLSKCCYCVHAKIENEVKCKKYQMLTDDCADMKAVENVSDRFNFLFVNLPNGYICR